MAEPAPYGRVPRTGAGSGSGDNSNHGNAAISSSRSQPSESSGAAGSGLSAAGAPGGRGESASEEQDEEEDENGKGGEGYQYAPQRQRDDEETRRAAQSLLCHEKIEEFVDPTLFQRLVAPSAASLAAAAAASAEEEEAAAAAAAAAGRATDASRKRALWLVAPGQIPPNHQPRGSISTAAEGESETAPKRPANAKRRPSHPGASGSHANSAAGAPSLSAPVSPPYMHSWEALGLGTTRGTAAWNRALVEVLHSQSGGNPVDWVPQLTSEEVLDVVRSRCRLRTIRPPHGSPVVQPLPPSSSSSTAPASGGPAAAAAAAAGAAGGSSPSLEDEEAATDCEAAAADRAWFVRTLLELRGAMVAQDSVAGAGAQRYVEATAGDVLEKLRQIENDRARLQLREERVLALSRQLGLITRETRVESLRMRGIVRNDVDADLDAVGSSVAGAEEGAGITPGATETTRKKEKSASISPRGTYWRQDFDRLLEERRSQGAETFLFPHDAY